MVIVPFQIDHLAQLELQDAQVAAVSHASDEYLYALVASGPAFTAMANGKVIACCGVAMAILGTGTMWAFVSREAGKHMVKLDRYARRLLTAMNVPRIEATVEKGFVPGCRWLELLGFDFEGEMRKYGPGGETHLRYARIT